MQHKGAQELSNAELLALLIGSGNRGESSVHLMQRLLSSVDNNIPELHAIALEKMMEWNRASESGQDQSGFRAG